MNLNRYRNISIAKEISCRMLGCSRTFSESSSLSIPMPKLKQQASRLTLQLWKNSIRSIEKIRLGNDYDEHRFAKLEQDQINKPEMIPLNREDELKSRANYYYNWARELIEQESDIFSNYDDDKEANDSFTEEQVRRFFYFLRDGEEKRKFILLKYQFDDPCKGSFDNKYVDQLEREMLNACLQQSVQSPNDFGLSHEIDNIFTSPEANAEDYLKELEDIFGNEEEEN